MKNNKKLFIEEGFPLSILSWILVIMSEYCNEKNINEIIISKKQKDIKKNKIITDCLKKIKFSYLDDLLPFYLKNNFLLNLILIPKSVTLSFFWKKT